MFMKLQLQSERKKNYFVFLWHESNLDKDAVQVHSEKV